MGEISPPTGSDYSWGQASQANTKIEALEKRVERLEKVVQALLRDKALSEL